MSQARKQIEELAKKRGVSLAPPIAASPAGASPAASEPAQAAQSGKVGFLAAHMPEAAAMMRDLRAQIGAQLYRGILDNLKQGRGYVVDHTTRLAVGRPPAQLYELGGKEERRDGYPVRRARPRA